MRIALTVTLALSLLLFAACDDGGGGPDAGPGAPDVGASTDTGPQPDGTPPDGMALDGMPPDGMPLDGTPPDGMPLDGTPPDGTPPDGMALDGTPPDGMPPDVGADPDAGPPPPPDGLLFAADFEAPGPGWPEPWRIAGGVLDATVQDGMGCLVPSLSDYSLARMVAPLGANEAEALFTLRFSDIEHQGVGFYLRSNGGYLATADPLGSGYAVFVEGFRNGPGIGVWREVDGVEQEIRVTYDAALALQDDVRYRVRFRVTRLNQGTDLRARIWPEGQPEPIRWQVEATDETPGLQDLPLGVAVDSWNDYTPGDPGPDLRGPTCVDDIRIRAISNPLHGAGSAELMAEGLQFTEGPVWDAVDGSLLFTDIPADTIYRLAPGGQPQPAVRPSGNANGLAFAPDGSLLACQHAGRVVRLPRPMGELMPPADIIADAFEGQALNSPNDVAVRADGTVYFTDPPYGRPGGRPGPLGFMGVFRVTPDGAITAEYRGPPAERPNGIALSPDEAILYVADTATGSVHGWDVAPDGRLANRRQLLDEAPNADGMAVAPDGTLFIATARGVVVADGQGNHWGVLPVPRQPSNCALGPDGMLYVTAREAVYRIPTAAPGLRRP